VTPFLLEVNVLISLVRPKHSGHETVMEWFKSAGRPHWATCALTEAGFVRVVSNPRFTSQAVEVREARQILSELTALPGHQFWSLDFGFADAVRLVEARFFGHQQVTDTYMLTLAIRNKGKLVTQDRRLLYLAGKEFADHILLL
jgi:toxin-antitoxin system PIN domain toxin